MHKVLALTGALLFASAQGALSQEFPARQPIKMIVAANAGGGSDVMARVISEFLSKKIGQAVVVENKPGAASVIGADFVAKSPPDGYTIYYTAAELSVIPAVRSDLPYKFEDFTYLVRLSPTPILMYGSPSLPAKDFAELVAFMKANPGKVRYGSTGVGAIVHLGLAMFEGAAGVKGTHIPYTGAAPVYTDMLAGVVEITQATAAGVPDGIRVLGSVSSRRHPGFPDRPTLEEAGIKGASWDLWAGVLAPPNLPKPIADKLTAALLDVLNDPEALDKIEKVSKNRQNPKEYLTGEDFRKATIESNKAWKEVAQREKISLK